MSAQKRRSSIASFNRQQSLASDIWDRAAVWVTKSMENVHWEKGVVISKSFHEEERKFSIRVVPTDEIVEISTTSIDKQNLEFVAVKRRDVSLNGSDIDDMTSLLYMNEPELLECVQQRYFKKSIYTSIGPILLAINPFERLPIYDDDTLLAYHTDVVSHRLTRSPHVFHVANRAYNNMFVDKFRPEERENQAILVNGESGAGKTESTKHVLHFLAVISSKVASQIQVSDDMNTEIENQILASNPILESFGNAKTTRNNNSSRFGKFIELLYASDGYIEGAVMRTYLLETMRVASQGKGERNYHVFYQVHAGLDKYSRTEYGLTELSNFNYTNQSGEYHRQDGESDLDNFAELKDAFTTLGIDDEIQTEVDRVIVAILHIGNLSFTDSQKAGEDAAEFASTPANTTTVNYICGLLAVRKEVLLTAVGRRSVTVVGNTIEKTLNSEAAIHARDSLAKFLYNYLFTWVVGKINTCLTGKIAPDQCASFIGVLDIFGFEHFAKNSFEQLCINYTNEKLQDHFNYSVFKSEQEVYKQEGLKWTFIAYPDNSARLDLLEHNTNGILSVCNEQLKLPKATDEKLASALYQKCGSHPYFRATRPEMVRHEFTILHYACPVTYQAEGFLDKNRTENPKELYDLLVQSTNPLLTEMTPPEYRVEQSITPSKGGTGRGGGGLSRGPSFRGGAGGLTRAPSQRFNKISRTSTTDSGGNDTLTQKARPTRGTVIGKKVSSLSVQFQTQLGELITKIRSTRSHFICCVKPNKLMAPAQFDAKMCTDQLRCSGSLGAIQVFKAGFANRLSFAAFTARFAAIAFVAGNNPLTNGFKEHLFHARATGLSDHWRSAAGRLFEIVPMSHTVLALVHNESPQCDVDFHVDMQMGYSQIFLKAAAFEFLEKLQLRTRNLTARRLQLRWRAWRVSRHVDSKIKTTSGMFRAQEAMRYFSDFRRIAAIKRVSATILLQRRTRVFLAVKYRKWMIKQFIRVQRLTRRFLKKMRLERLRNKSARALQRTFRTVVIRRRYLKYRHAMVILQSRYRGKKSRRLLKLRLNAEKRGLWSVLRLQSIHRGNNARMQFFALKRAAIAKRFENQLQREQRKSEMLSLLEAKLDENPDLLNYIQGVIPQQSLPPPPPSSSSQSQSPARPTPRDLTEINQLRSEIANLKEKIRVLEEENSILQNRLMSNPSTTSATTPLSPIRGSGSVDEWKTRAEQLEKENFELRKSLLVKRKTESGHSTSRKNLFTSVDENEDEFEASLKPAAALAAPAPLTPRTADPRDLIRRRLSLNHDAAASQDQTNTTVTDEGEHPDWVKKYSDQHKRPYWRNKTTGKTSWTPPVAETSSSTASSSAAGAGAGGASATSKAAPIPAPYGQQQENEDASISPGDLRIAVDRLISGWDAMKLSSSNYPKERTIVIDRKAQVLSWKKGTSSGAKVDGSLNLDTIKRITRGRKSRTLEKVKGVDANLCLSIHYTNTSLDLQLSSETERNMMYFALKEITKVN